MIDGIGISYSFLNNCLNFKYVVTIKLLNANENCMRILLLFDTFIFRPLHLIQLFTVQEQMIVTQSRNLIGWLDGYGANGSVEDTFAFLPNPLNSKTFLFPSVGMFGKLNVHRLCFYAGELIRHFVITCNMSDSFVPGHNL